MPEIKTYLSDEDIAMCGKCPAVGLEKYPDGETPSPFCKAAFTQIRYRRKPTENEFLYIYGVDKQNLPVGCPNKYNL